MITDDRIARAERMADEIIAIADDPFADLPDTGVGKAAPGGKVAADKEALARAKLRIDVRMWLMARLAPHLYGTPNTKAFDADDDPLVNFIISTHPPIESGT